MNIIIIRALLVIPILLSFMQSYAQEQYVREQKTDSIQTELKRNVVYGTIGLALVYGALNANYERMLIERKSSFLKSYWIKFSTGLWGTFDQSGLKYVISFTTLTGSKSSHLELNAGLTLLQSSGYVAYFGPAGAIGFRLQKRNNPFVFRTGIGFPDAVYLSLGFSF